MIATSQGLARAARHTTTDFFRRKGRQVTISGIQTENLQTEGLNSPQKDAIVNLSGPQLILAGAGSGKTRVITHRIASTIAERLAGPSEILAVTFTNKAAREMESRVLELLPSIDPMMAGRFWITTFHSACVRILRQTIHLLEYDRNFTIYDDGDQLSLIKKVMTALDLSDKVTPAKAFRARINSAKVLGLTPDQVEKSSRLYLDKVTIEVYRRYEQTMKLANALDFGDLLLKVLEIFRMYPDVLDTYRKQFKYVLVDEYQDTNRIQYLIVKLLAEQHRNLCVVGDEDQSIYSWRGADISNILDFEKDFPDARVTKLEQNYRSTQTIVTAASKVIAHNSQRKDKTLFTANPAGEKIAVREERSEYDEAKWVTKQIQNLLQSGEIAASEVAIFYRTNAQSRVLEEHLRMASLPYRILGGVRFYERLEIKDILAYLKFINNPSDDVSLKRIINTPTRGIGKGTIETLELESIRRQCPMLKAAELCIAERTFPAAATAKIRRFIDLIQDLRSQAGQLQLLDLFTLVVDRTEYVQRLKAEDSVESQSRIENLEELGNAIAAFQNERTDASLQSFLEEMSLVSDVDALTQSENAITLMTLHLSKGLEFPIVFIVGMEEGLFPSAQSIEGDDNRSVEEERRLAYVGMTRARKLLHLTYARTRRVWGQEHMHPPSRFVGEIPPEFVQFSTAFEVPKFMSRHASAFQNLRRSEQIDASPGFEEQSFPEDTHGPSGDYSKGARVRHPTFGVGTVYETEGAGDQLKLSILFADQTIKKFVAKYARLQRV